MSQSNDQIYELLNQLRLEIKGDIAAQGLSTSRQLDVMNEKLDAVVEKRIVPIEKDVKDLQVSSATGNVKLGALIFIGASTVGALVGAVVTKVVG